MKSQSIPDIIRLASIVSVALPLIVYFLKIRHASKPIHFIGVLVIISAISDMAAYMLFARGESTVILVNIYYIVLLLLLTWFYYEIVLNSNTKITILIGLGLYLFSFVLITLYLQPFSEYQTFSWTIIGVLMIVYSISYFLSLFSTETLAANNGFLWINSGVLFYFSFNLALFLMSSYVLTKLEPQITTLIWSFHNINNIIKNVLLGFGISAFASQRANSFAVR